MSKQRKNPIAQALVARRWDKQSAAARRQSTEAMRTARKLKAEERRARAAAGILDDDLT